MAAKSRSKIRTKRYIKELIHNFRFTYEDISKSTGIDIHRLKAINKKEEPTREESVVLGRLAMSLSRQRGEDTGEQSD